MPDSTLRDRLAWLYPPPPPPPDDGGGPLPEVVPLADRVPWLYSGERKGAGSWQHPSQFAPEGEGTLDPHGLPDPAGVRPQPPQLVNPPARFPGRGARAVSGLKEEAAAGRQQPATQPLPPPPEPGKLGEWLRSHPHGADKALLLHLFGSRDPWAAMHPDDLSAAREGLAGAPPQQLLRLLHGLNGSGVHDPARHRIVHEAMASRPEGPEVPLTDRNRPQAYQFPDDGSMSDDDRRRLEQSLRALPRVKGLPGAFLLPAGLDPDRVFPGAGAKRLDEAAVDEAREASPAVWFQRPLPSEEEARSDDAAWRPLGVQSMNTYYGGNLWQVRYPDGRSYVAKLHHDPGEADVEAAAAGALRLMGFRDVPRMEVRPTRHGRTLFQSHAPGKELFAATGKDLRKIEKANPPEKLAELMAGMWLLNADDRHSGNYLFDADGRVYPIDLGFSLSPREFSREGWGQHRDALVEDGLVSRDQLVSPEFVRRAAGLRDRVLAHVERSLASQPEDYRRAAMAAIGRRFDWLSRAAAEGRPVRLRDLPPLGSPKLPYRPAGSPERYRVEDLGGSGGGRGSFRPPHQEFVQEPLVKIHRAGPAHPHAAPRRYADSGAPMPTPALRTDLPVYPKRPLPRAATARPEMLADLGGPAAGKGGVSLGAAAHTLPHEAKENALRSLFALRATGDNAHAQALHDALAEAGHADPGTHVLSLAKSFPENPAFWDWLEERHRLGDRFEPWQLDSRLLANMALDTRDGPRLRELVAGGNSWDDVLRAHQQHHGYAVAVVTRPKGSWKWQDAYGVTGHVPKRTRDGRWVWDGRDMLVGKASLPQLRAMGWLGERTPEHGRRIRRGGMHHRELTPEEMLLTGLGMPGATDPTPPGELPYRHAREHPAAEKVAAAAADVHPDPSPAQVEASNHKMGHVRLHGLDVTLEAAKGGTRTKVGKDGKPWSRKMHAHYGRIRRTEAADGEHLDVYLGDHPQSELVVVVEQLKENGRHDEYKCVLGCTSKAEAVDLYLRHYPEGWGKSRVGDVRLMTVPQFKEWAFSPQAKKPFRSAANGGPERYSLQATKTALHTLLAAHDTLDPAHIGMAHDALEESGLPHPDEPLTQLRQAAKSAQTIANNPTKSYGYIKPGIKMAIKQAIYHAMLHAENQLNRPGYATRLQPVRNLHAAALDHFENGRREEAAAAVRDLADYLHLHGLNANVVREMPRQTELLRSFAEAIRAGGATRYDLDNPHAYRSHPWGLGNLAFHMAPGIAYGTGTLDAARELLAHLGDVYRHGLDGGPERFESRHADDDARNGGGNSAPEGVQYARGSERPRAASTAGVAGPTPREGQSVSQSTDSSTRTPQRYSEAWPHPALLHVERHGGFAHGAPFHDPDTFPPPDHPHAGDHWAIAGAMGNAIKGRPIGIGFRHHRSGLSPAIQTMQLPGDARPRRQAVEERQVFLSDPEGRITAGHYRMPLGVVVGRGRNYNASQLDPEAVRRYLDAQLPGLGGYLTDWPLRAGAADRHDLKSWEEMTPEERGNIERHLRRMAAEHARALRTGHTYAVVHAHPGIKPFLQSATGRGDEGLAELIDRMQEAGHPNAAQWAEMYHQARGEGYPLLHTNLLGQMMRTPFDAGPLRASRAPSGEARAAERHAATGSPQRYSESPLKLQGPLVGVRHHGHFGYDGAIGGRTESDGINRGQYIHAAASAAARALAHDSPHGVTVRSKPIGGRREMSHVFALPDGRVAANRAMRNNIPTTDAQLASALGPPESHWLHGDDFPPALHPNTISRGQRDARIMMGAAVEDADRTGRLHAHVAIHPDPHFREVLKNAVLGGPAEAGMLADWLRERGHEDEASRLVGPDGQILHHGPAVAGALAEEIPGEE